LPTLNYRYCLFDAEISSIWVIRANCSNCAPSTFPARC
jgi:hypothetical protein